VSVESDICASLLAHAPLAALIGDLISPDKVLQDASRPFVIYTVQREPHHTIDNVLRSTLYTFTLQVWADTRASADTTADAVEAALAASALEGGGIPVDERQTISESDLDLEGNEIVFTYWRDS
jgi:hypothetical protein